MADRKARAAYRFGAEYVMRSLQILSSLANGDLVAGLVSMAINQANVAHLNPGAASGPFDGIDQPPPDEVRRPVSVLALSTSLGMPYETTRRCVARLIAAGQCRRVKGGVIVPADALASDRHPELLRANHANLRRLMRNLRTAGIEPA